MPFDINNEEFQNWLKGVFGLNTTRTALCECISDKLDNILSNNSYEELHQFFLCLKANNISLLNAKSKGSKDKKWECEHNSCRDIMHYFIDNHKQGHKLRYTWAPLGPSESTGTEGGGYHCTELKWKVIKLYMHMENEDDMKTLLSLECLDITHVIKMMRNCKLISKNDLDELLEKVLKSRNKFMHSPDNKMTDIETRNTLQCTRKLLDSLDIDGKKYYEHAVQELKDLSENDFVLRYQSENCKRILADVIDAKHLADELYSNIKENNLLAKSQSKRLQDMLERITGLMKDEGFLELVNRKEDSLDIENASLLDEIVELLDMGRDAEVILLIGQSGAGKTSMLNTIHRVITREPYLLAKQGAGYAGSVTIDLSRYDNCGVDLKNIRDESRRKKIAKVVYKLPHIVDCAGLGDDDSPALREILELLVGGFIPKATHIAALQAKQEKFGVGCLRKLYPKSNPADRVTKIVFVQSCGNAIPRNLINCLNEVLNITDPTILIRKYTAEVFLLISKYDLVRDQSVHISTGSDEDSMTLEDFVKKENELAPEFNIMGALEANRIRWASYTDKIQGRNKHIENIALKFLRRMVQPGTPKIDTTDRQEPVVGSWTTFDLYMFRLTNQIKQFFLQGMQLNITPAWCVTAVVFVVVFAVLYKLLMSSV